MGSMEARAVPREAAAGSPGLIAPRLLRAATDARLVALVRQGQEAAFEAIYDRYHRPILSFSRHMLGDQEEAADAVQHTFAAAYTAITDSDKPLLLRPWLFTIARNRCYSVLRTRREQPAGELIEPATEGLAAQVQRREDLRQLLVDMRELPDEQRAALVMAELGALNHNEIGSALGVPAGKVKALVFQARESLLASRSARDTDCSEIRRELASARGAALRRANLRRHLRECQGCREYRRAVQRQRRQLAAILPVAAPAALKESVLGSTIGGGTSTAGALSGGLLVSSAFKGLALKVIAGVLIAVLGTAATIGLVHALAGSGAPNALADTGQPAVGATGEDPILRAGAVPLASAADHRFQLRHGAARTAGHRPSATDQALLVPVSRRHRDVTGTTRRSVAAVSFHSSPSAPRHASAPATSRHEGGVGGGGGGGQGGTGSGGQGGTDSGGHHGQGHANGHDPGQNPGLHLGWGQGDGGGRTHPHGANPHG